MENVENYKAHVFICVKCGEKDLSNPNSKGHQIRKSLKQWADQELPEDKKKLVRINASGCLNQCDHGVATVCYPKGEWCLNMNLEGLDPIKRIIKENI